MKKTTDDAQTWQSHGKLLLRKINGENPCTNTTLARIMMLCAGVGCGTENLQLRLPLFSLYTQRKFLQFSSQSPSPPHTISTLYRHHHSVFSSFLASFTDLCRFPLFFSLFSDTEPTEREENVSRQAKFCAALAASSLHKFPQHFPTMAFLSPPSQFRTWIRHSLVFSSAMTEFTFTFQLNHTHINRPCSSLICPPPPPPFWLPIKVLRYASTFAFISSSGSLWNYRKYCNEGVTQWKYILSSTRQWRNAYKKRVKYSIHLVVQLQTFPIVRNGNGRKCSGFVAGHYSDTKVSCWTTVWFYDS